MKVTAVRASVNRPNQAEQDNQVTSRLASRWWQAGWPLLAYLALTIVFTWPLVLHLNDQGIRTRSSDLWQNLWNLWWVKHALFELHTSPFRTNLLFYPDTPSLYLHALNPLGGLVSSPLQVLFGLVTAFNLMVGLALSLSAYCAYRLARYLQISAGAAFLSGLVFVFNPVISSELNMSQLEQLTLLWIPLYILFFWRALKPDPATSQPRLNRSFWRDALLAAFVLLGSALTTWYYTLDLLIFSGLAGLVWSGLAVWRWNWPGLKRLAVLLVLGGLGLAPLAWLTAQAASRTPSAAARNSSVLYNSADFPHFFVPGQSVLWASGPIEGQEFGLFLGYGALILAGLGLVGRWDKSKGWAGLLLVFGLLSLGPQLKLGPENYTNFPLPGALLQSLPVVGNFFRVPARLLAFAMLPLGLLAGWGLDWLLGRLRSQTRPHFARWGRLALTVAVVGLVFLEYWPGSRTLVNLSLSSTAWQQIQPPGAVLSLPYSELSGVQMYEQTAHGQPVVGGYLARQPGFDFISQAPIIRELTQSDPKISAPDFVANDWARTLLPALNVYGVRYIVIHREQLADDQSEALDQLIAPILANNPPIGQDGPVQIYRVPTYNWAGRPVPGWLDQGTGWHAEETNSMLGTYRWATGSEATLTLLNPNPGPVRYRLEWTLFSYARPHQVALSLNEFSIGQKEAPTTPQAQSFELELPPGRSTLKLQTDQPAARPQDVEPGSTDQRLLSFAIARLRLTAL